VQRPHQVLRAFGQDAFVMNEAKNVIVLAYCNCWHSLEQAVKNETLQLPIGVKFSDIETSSSSSDSGREFLADMRKMLAAEDIDAKATAAVQKVYDACFYQMY
jgi:hypothetical protein